MCDNDLILKNPCDLSTSDLSISNAGSTCKAASWRHGYLYADTIKQAQTEL